MSDLTAAERVAKLKAQYDLSGDVVNQILWEMEAYGRAEREDERDRQRITPEMIETLKQMTRELRSLENKYGWAECSTTDDVPLHEVARALGVEDATRECPNCEGTGQFKMRQIEGATHCYQCDGHGRVPLTLDEIVDAGLEKERERCARYAALNHHLGADYVRRGILAGALPRGEPAASEGGQEEGE